MQTQILQAQANSIQRAYQLLLNSELVAIPTETVYGLAAHAFDEQAVARIFAAKERPKFDPLIVHLAQQPEMSLQTLAEQDLIQYELIPDQLQQALNQLIQSYWPGPLTLVLPRHARVPDLVTSGLDTVALRVPAHPVAQALLDYGLPLAAPSANRFGRISPTTAQAVYDELKGRIPLILDGGPCEIGLESSVVGIQDQSLCLLRPGKLGLAELSTAAGLTVALAQAHPAEVRAPGMLKSHYAPRLPLKLMPSETELLRYLQSHSERPGVLLLESGTETTRAIETRSRDLGGKVIYLSQNGDLAECARSLFTAMRELDQDLDYLLAVLPAAGDGLSHAIRDRLAKAAYNNQSE